MTKTFGPVFEEQFDGKRVRTQMQRVLDYMLGNPSWRTLAEIGAAINAPESSVSAQLRHLRKPRFGGYTLELRSRGKREVGLFEYKLTDSGNSPMPYLRRKPIPQAQDRLSLIGRKATKALTLLQSKQYTHTRRVIAAIQALAHGSPLPDDKE